MNNQSFISSRYDEQMLNPIPTGGGGLLSTHLNLKFRVLNGEWNPSDFLTPKSQYKIFLKNYF